MLVVWSTDTGGDPNLFTSYRSFGADGRGGMAAERVVETARDGEPLVAGAWLPQVTAMRGGDFAGTFAVTGDWAHPDAERFHVFLQRLAPSGEPLGDFATPYLEPGVAQLYPAIAADSGGGVHLAWTRQTDSGIEDVVQTGLAAGGEAFGPLPPPEAFGEDSFLIRSAEASYSRADPSLAAPDVPLHLAVTQSELKATVFVVWTERRDSELRIMGAFLQP